jgi:hypothetical protein
MTTQASIPLIYNFSSLIPGENYVKPKENEKDSKISGKNDLDIFFCYRQLNGRTGSFDSIILQSVTSNEDYLQKLYSIPEMDSAPGEFAVKTMTSIGEIPFLPIDQEVEQCVEDFFNEKEKPCKKIFLQKKF